MNPITFNRELKDGHDFMMMSDDGKESWITLENEVRDAPIFVWDDLEDDKLLSLPDHSDVLRKIESEPNLLPFKFLRLYARANLSDAKDGTKGFKAWIQHKGGVLTVRAAMQGPVFLDQMYHITTRVGSDAFDTAVRVENGFLSKRFLDGNAMLKDHLKALMTSIAWFIREVSSTSNFVASVSPDKQGKSVEWMKARTHYVVVHKAHPANRVDVASGAKVAITEESIKRQAHSRRAHARVLRSPRFRHKMGQVIHVKACWVGPNEWKQFGSIYRMTNFSSASSAEMWTDGYTPKMTANANKPRQNVTNDN